MVAGDDCLSIVGDTRDLVARRLVCTAGNGYRSEIENCIGVQNSSRGPGVEGLLGALLDLHCHSARPSQIEDGPSIGTLMFPPVVMRCP